MSAHARMRHDSAKFPKQETGDSNRRKVYVADGEFPCQRSFAHNCMWFCTPGISLSHSARLEADTAQEEGSTGHGMGLSRRLPGLSIHTATF